MVEIIQCDFKNPVHRQKVVELIDAYMQDPMGGGNPMPAKNKTTLVEGLQAHPTAFVLFAIENGEYVGIATCFINFSTFNVKPYINIHDLAVISSVRGKGTGRKLLERIIEIARERNYCKVNLEVRSDNLNAQGLYKSLGFKECDPSMYFWERKV